MKKRVLSLFLALALVISLVIVPGFKSEAASYPTIIARKAQYKGQNGIKNTACEYDVTFQGGHKNYRFVVDVYDSTGKRRTGTSQTYYNSTGKYEGVKDTIIYSLTPSGFEPGTTLTIVAKMQYAEDYTNYYDAPNAQTTTFVITGKSSTHKNEWYNGRWYDADGNQNYDAVLVWMGSGSSWWVQDTKGWYPTNQWLKIDGYWYYFTASGYMDYGEYRDGWWLNSDGTCSNYPQASWYADSYGWYYMDASGWYPTNQYLWIDGACYWFDGWGYAH